MSLSLPCAIFTACTLLLVTSFAEAASSESSDDNVTAAPQIPDDELQHIEVTGRALSLYKSDHANLGTRTNTAIEKIPQSIQVLTQALITDQAAYEISDLYRSISGVSYNNFSTVTMRGFAQDEILYDGLKGDPFSGFSIPQLFSIQEIQVLKGPSGAVYGAGDSGGVINYVTKKPTYEAINTMELGLGNKDFLSGSIESSGPINEAASQRYRVGVFISDEGSYRNNVDEQNRSIDVGYGWDINANNTLTVQYNHIYQHIDGARLRGIPTDDDGNFLTNTSWNNNEASDYQELTANVLQLNLRTDINSWLSSQLNARYYTNKETQNYHELNALIDSDEDGEYDETKRQYRDRYEQNKGAFVAGYLVAELADHTLVFGTDYTYNTNDYLYYRATGEDDGVSNLSLFNPVYGQDDINDYVMTLYADEHTVLNQMGLFAQDQWAITDKLNLVVSARGDYIDEDFSDYKDNATASYHDLGYSTRLGATYSLNSQVIPYMSYSTGFSPQSAEDQNTSEDGSLFDPEESQQFEMGVRSFWFDKKMNLNLAAFHIERKNMLAEDVDNDDYNVAIGKIRSQGLEVDIITDITSRWVANINYAYNDVTVSDTDNDYQYTANIPRHQLGVWTRYDFPSINSSIALGMDYVSEQRNRSNQIVKPYTIFDLSWQTQWQDWKIQANVKNLFDKEYAISGFTETIGSYVGERRRLYLMTSYDF
ncbi:TonB-dependent receptor [Alteromonas sp. C1M14]|uniref:TonB-dependent siderophore receptor n=1 Tax=Alteromonas sp. C1M14 TaxID=2841567 RepID=UPI001C0A1AB5|nr:TonB-dependent receptor [Alteromonas sp. C1M14]MBU2979563.1 TonB-dependent receptor [Alteromonas sp. C1M14]